MNEPTETEFVTHCPHCGKRNEFHSNMDGDTTPSPGALSICFGCVELSMYGDDLQLVLIPEEQYREVSEDPYVRRAIAAVRTVRSGAHNN